MRASKFVLSFAAAVTVSAAADDAAAAAVRAWPIFTKGNAAAQRLRSLWQREVGKGSGKKAEAEGVSRGSGK